MKVILSVALICLLTGQTFAGNLKRACQKANEKYTKCGNTICQISCAYPEFPHGCEASCTPGCICKKGYLRSANGECVIPENCDSCKDNEVYSACDNHGCRNTCAEPNLITRCSYVAGCYPGCICVDGYLRDTDGTCVPEKQCDDACPPNEVYTECGNHPCQNTCASPDLSARCRYIPGCYPGCICKPGYLRNSKKQCVPEKNLHGFHKHEHDNNDNEHDHEHNHHKHEHDREHDHHDHERDHNEDEHDHQKHENDHHDHERDREHDHHEHEHDHEHDHHDHEHDHQEHENDHHKWKQHLGCGGDPNAIHHTCGDPCPLTCYNYNDGPLVCNKICQIGGGCCCRPGYVRDHQGKCILPSECPKCGPNECYNCGSPCDAYCSTLDLACPIVNIKCINMCYCNTGFARNNQGVCVPIKQCPPKQCPPNQVINVCPNDCPPEKTCASYVQNFIIDCARPLNERICVPRCECKPGYIRLVPNGDCVLPSQCCDDPNAEMVDCPNPCSGGTCQSPAFDSCKLPCKFRGCQCKAGYVKDKSGKCIPITQCPPKCTGPNEVYTSCKDPCPDSCKYIINNIPQPLCLPPFPCPGGCNCLPGYVRNDLNICVKPETCQCKDPNAVLVACPNPCPGGTCELQSFSLCKAQCKEFGCQCKPGYVKNALGICILIKDCPAKCTGPNEISVECVNTCPNLCIYLTSPGPHKPCPIPGPCVKGCDCLPGYYRNGNNICVAANECQCSDTNAEVVKCPNPCAGGTCQSPLFSLCTASCKLFGCQCKTGYVLDASGKCILLSDCPAKCFGPNEVSVKCANTCPALCSYVTNNGPQPICPVNGPCIKGCDCLPGFYRNNNNICVKVNDCSCADPNAEVVACPNPCPGGTCDSPNFSNCSLSCKANGCQCKKGYVKNSVGKCIKLEDCPAKCILPNEESVTCVDSCPAKCSAITNDIPEPPCIPSKICVKGCNCLPGYRRNNKNICVIEKECDCPDPNAEVVTSPNPCQGGTCEFPEFAICGLAPKPLGCQCKKGFVKDINGQCIPLSSCPSCKNPNEQYKYCGSWCPPTCDDRNVTCREICVRGCFCKPGFIRNDGLCILIKDCPPTLVCGPNEVPNKCPKPCPPQKTCDQYLNDLAIITCPAINKFPCVPRCDCAPGYIRNNKGVCVLPEKCCEDPNAEVVDCPNPCPLTCDNLGNYESLPCLKKCPFKGCACKNGYVKNSNGICILQKDCPPKSCSINEKWNPCPGYCSFDKTCEMLLSGNLPSCPPPPPNLRKCIPRCECLEGYVRVNGVCLPQDTCCNDVNAKVTTCPLACDSTCFQTAKPGCSISCVGSGCVCKTGFVKGPFDKCIAFIDCPKCGPNEVFRKCGTKCEATCDEGFPKCETDCKPGCFCIPGYIRHNGICILISDCPAVCTGPNEISVKCVNNCPPLCSYITETGVLPTCPPKGPCVKGCDCLPGYYRNGKNICVKEVDCTCPDPNAVVVPCPNPCSGGTCLLPPFASCGLTCKPFGCQCKNGYVKNAAGKCILLIDCPAICTGQNEVSVPCVDTCPLLCSSVTNNGLQPICPPKGLCIKGCNCLPGYYRNNNNICVEVTKCSCLDPNAIVVSCPNPCSGGTCDFPSFAKCNLPCKLNGCQCKEGYVKNSVGKCILLEDCPAKCVGPNEVSVACVDKCPPRCISITSDSVQPPCVQVGPCVKGCNCLPGYYRNSENICVSVNECGCPDPNAEVVQCPNPCQGGTCEFPEFFPCKAPCKAVGCQCKQGFVKDLNGKCIPLLKCPSCENPNEVYKYCGTWCQPTCDDRNPTCRLECARGCFCKPGFIRNSEGVCILIKNCPPPLNCTINEVPNKCPKPCPPQKTCDQYLNGISITCPVIDKFPCVGRCDCAPGYIRNNKGLCVLPENCCEDPNAEVVDCPNLCPLSCDNLENFESVICIKKCPLKGCACKNGYVKNSNGICILQKDCPPKKCNINEVYDPCPQYCSFDPTCRTLLDGFIPGCPAPPLNLRKCIPKCKCLPGYVKTNGVCVPQDTCCNDINAEITPCPMKCDSTCFANPLPGCQVSCVISGCKCKAGFVKGPFGYCIARKDCPVCDPNEEFKVCGTKCEPTCGNLAPKCESECKVGCFCAPGYIRHNGKCILITDCPAVCTGPNEVSVPCMNTCPLLCSAITDDNNLPTCPLKKPCIKGCDCLPGFYRNSKNVCVKAEDCICPDPNAEVVPCPNPCPGGTCLLPSFSPCKLACKPFGCQCRKGYVKSAAGTCIPLFDCPAICTGENEVSVPCVDTCPALCSYITDNGAQPKCPPKGPCVKGCNCLPGYYRNSKNVCVLVNQCNCLDPNAEVVPCPNPCSGGTCDSPSFVNCNLPCKENGCQCKKGFVKNAVGVCIRIEDCPAKCVGPNEVSVPCKNTCPAICSSVTNDKPLLLCPINAPCVKGCDCASGFYRNNQNICVNVTKCDCADPNAEVVQCPNPCPGGTCESPKFDPCKLACKPLGCQCKKDYVKDENGKCIPLPNCPSCKNPNEEYKYCGTWCQPTCDDKTPICREICVKGCFCKPGYIRNNEGVCILIKDCPPPLNCTINEVENKCPKPCPPQKTCDHYLNNLSTLCPVVDKFPCVARCECATGYIRNNKGVCVLPEKCCEDPNAEVVDCPNPCPLSCDNLENFESILCLKKCSFKGCACKSGYVKNSNGICILQKECPAKKCNINEIYNPCPAYCSFDDTCQSLLAGIKPVCAAPPPNLRKCIPKCECIEGYVRTNGICVPEDTCCNDVNAEMSPCPLACDPTCFDKPQPGCKISCALKGCKCKAGFVRGLFDKCINPKQCPSCNKPNEEYKVCGTKCEPTCDDRFPTCIKDCQPGCFCKPGYIRCNGDCILISDCPIPCHGPNEEYQACGTACPKTCENKDKTINCIEKCVKGCFCKPGYVRNMGVCIKIQKCPVCDAPNQEFLECGTACPLTCENKDKFMMCPAMCVSGCFCKNGYVLKYGKCVPIDECRCGPCELWTNAAPDCPETCTKPQIVCKTTKPGCICAPGYIRDCIGGECIELAQCKKKKF